MKTLIRENLDNKCVLFLFCALTRTPNAPLFTAARVQVALVAVQSVDTLKTAYPNYFSDTRRFLKELEVALHGGAPIRCITNI